MHNYCLISLLNLFGEVFEKIICHQISDYMKESRVLSQAHYGFRKCRSRETALTRLTNLFFTARCAKHHTVIATIDFSRAFNSMSFSHPLNALTSHGFTDQSMRWFSSCLQGRTQRIKYFNVVSPVLLINFGMPEGSI